MPLHAGQRLSCPDLLDEKADIKAWQVHGAFKKSEFSHVLISRTKVIGKNTITCKYAADVSLTRVGNFQKGSELGLWQITNLGGVLFYQCLATREECFFYGVSA